MALKKNTLGNASAKSLAEAFRCGECLHFKTHPHLSRKELCSKEGVRAYGVAPKCFTPDIPQIAQNSDQFVQLAAMFTNYTPKQKRILLGMLRMKDKPGLAFGTKVYFLSFGKDYLSNYLSGYVMGYTSSGELILSGSPEQKARGRSYIAYLNDTDNLLTAKQWRAKRAELQAANKVIDPQGMKVRGSKVAQDGEPPTIDSVPAEWYDKHVAKKRRKTDVKVMVIT
jgi:hypothetical protein